uniref:Uncharacterized protein n=1 Tax=Arundo donax TaxID=35708 RepID=A0A0A9B0X2_ARUDO
MVRISTCTELQVVYSADLRISMLLSSFILHLEACSQSCCV